MAFDPAQAAQLGASWGTIAALSGADGTASHPMSRMLLAPQLPVRDLADAVHALCMLHGRQPGVIDHALAHNRHPIAADWLEHAREGFAVERAFLARLVSAAGPLPSTPGQAESESAVIAQRHALDMLSQSDRIGCAMGAAVALVLDWRSIRAILDSAANRFGIMIPAWSLPLEAETATIVASISDSPGVERAMAFGVQQVLAQHRGLWDLLEARMSAREHL